MNVAPVPQGFVLPDDHAPIDVEAFIAATPESARLRGMFFLSYLEEAKRKKLPLSAPRNYSGFKLYRLWRRRSLLSLELRPRLTQPSA